MLNEQLVVSDVESTCSVCGQVSTFSDCLCSKMVVSDYDDYAEQMVHELVDETGAFYTLIYERDGGITIIWDYEEE